MNIDGVIMRIGEGAVLNVDLALASGHLNEVSETGSGSALFSGCFKVHVIQGDVFRMLAHHAKAVKVFDVDVFQVDILALPEEGARCIAQGIAHLIAQTGADLAASGAVIEFQTVVAQVLNGGHVGEQAVAFSLGQTGLFVIGLGIAQSVGGRPVSLPRIGRYIRQLGNGSS